MKRLFLVSGIVILFTSSIYARFNSIDPKASSYPSVSPYVYALNNPVKFIDPDGKDSFLFTWASQKGQVGHSATGSQVRDQSGQPTGDVQVRHLWPANPVDNKQGTAPADYRTSIVSESDLNSVMGGEGRSADGILRIEGDAVQDNNLNSALDQAESNKTYDAQSNSCATYTQTGLNATGVNTGTGGTVTIKIMGIPIRINATTPVSVHNGVVNSGNKRVTVVKPLPSNKKSPDITIE